MQRGWFRLWCHWGEVGWSFPESVLQLAEYCCLVSLSSSGDCEMLHQQHVSALSEWGQELCGMKERINGEQRDTGRPFSVDNDKLIVICRKWWLINQMWLNNPRYKQKTAEFWKLFGRGLWKITEWRGCWWHLGDSLIYQKLHLKNLKKYFEWVICVVLST